jgi:ectoine hydroxylase-related dioxygenase (phytanoyl-CoA dioxygenase family)
MSSQTITIGDHELEFGTEYLSRLRDSSPIASDGDRLRERFTEDGYLFVRGLLEETRVINARNEILHELDRQDALAADAPLEAARIGSGSVGGFVHPDDDYRDAKLAYPNTFAMLEDDGIFEFFRRFIGEDPLTFNYKWIRAVGNQGHTDFHYDTVFMGRGTDELYTMWAPLAETPVERGPLVVCEGSNHFDGLIDRYETVDAAESDDTHLTDPFEIVDEYGGRWVTDDFHVGDAIIFGPYTLHGAVTNETDQYRLSTDTRWQSRNEPVDGRFVGVQDSFAN